VTPHAPTFARPGGHQGDQELGFSFSILDAEEKHLQDKSLVSTIRAAIDSETGKAATSSKSRKTLASSTRDMLL
jgi:hypothetical protein